jgi:hypothetical protein
VSTLPSPVTWWHTGERAGWQAPRRSPTLYRTDQWVTAFVRRLDAELRRIELTSVKTFETNRAALVVTGGDSTTQTLALHQAVYRDVLLFHPGLHPEVDRAVDQVVRESARDLALQGNPAAEKLRLGGRDQLLAEPGLLLHESVVTGLAELGLHGLPAVGVSGIVEVRAGARSYLLGAVRSNGVAVNPGCLGPSVDGGLPWNSDEIDPLRGLRSEIEVELPWLAQHRLELLGTVLPTSASTLAGGHRTLRCGVNVVYRATLEVAPEEVLRVPNHFEIQDLVLIDVTPTDERAGLPEILAYRDGGLVPLANVPPMSEPLASILGHCGVVDLATGPASASSLRVQRPSEGRAMTSKSVQTMELTLDDAWAEDLIERHSRISRVLDADALAEIAEGGDGLTLEKLGPVFDAVREFEFVRSSDRIKASDEARLFEALVYRLGRYLFSNSADAALAAHDLMLPLRRGEGRESGDPAVQNPIGLGYSSRLEEVKKQDFVEDREGIWRTEVTDKLDEINRDEAVQEYAEVARRGRLLCFCAALWILELKRSPRAVTVALDDDYRKSLSGDVIALFFRARGLLVSPVISAAQAQLGLQFVTTALETFGRNPGMHHTKANFLLRQSALTENEAESRACLDQALDSVETALKADAEFAKFYATRAKVKYRLRDRAGALTDIRAAIELARYSAASPAVQNEISGWEETLESWQLAPLGSGLV